MTGDDPDERGAAGFRYGFRNYKGACMRAAIVAVVVGTALNMINQGDAILGGGSVVIWKAALTYVIPFIVSTHGALTATGER